MEDVKQSPAGNSTADLTTVKTATLTFGQKLVGINFNPSNDDKVGKAKKLCADLADLLTDDYLSMEESMLRTQLYNHTIGEILNAQMNVVKVLTLKY
jgi:hypothetical protein